MIAISADDSNGFEGDEEKGGIVADENRSLCLFERSQDGEDNQKHTGKSKDKALNCECRYKIISQLGDIGDGKLFRVAVDVRQVKRLAVVKPYIPWD